MIGHQSGVGGSHRKWFHLVEWNEAFARNGRSSGGGV